MVVVVVEVVVVGLGAASVVVVVEVVMVGLETGEVVVVVVTEDKTTIENHIKIWLDYDTAHKKIYDVKKQQTHSHPYTA